VDVSARDDAPDLGVDEVVLGVWSHLGQEHTETDEKEQVTRSWQEQPNFSTRQHQSLAPNNGMVLLFRLGFSVGGSARGWQYSWDQDNQIYKLTGKESYPDSGKSQKSSRPKVCLCSHCLL
jgi:hypothetical protein